MMRRFLIIIVFFAVFLGLYAQKKDSVQHTYLSGRFSYGIIYAHHEDFKYFITDYVPGFELNYSFRTQGEKNWQRIYRYPETGFGYTFVNFGNPDVLGSAHAFFTYVNIPLIEKKSCLFSSKFAVGVSYLNKIFDLYDNKYNIAIGSHINAYLNINFDFRMLIYKQLWFSGGLGLSHFSNGGTTKPNKGINVFLPSMGFIYQLQKKEFVKPELPIPQPVKNYELSIIYAMGFTSLEPANTAKYFTSDVSVNIERQFSHRGRWGSGMDFFYDASIPYYTNILDTVANYSFTGSTGAGVHLSYDLVFGRTSFTIQFGAYFYKGNNFDEKVYHRFGLKYRFAEHWMAKLTLKTFWAQAKFPEFGVGYRIKW
ncbi:MAG: acyloxyacyl hydrolase [Bacteroidales bacterium]|nr:acyloxyacyl hydrolase [Bacteroidales bacterium]